MLILKYLNSIKDSNVISEYGPGFQISHQCSEENLYQETLPPVLRSSFNLFYV